MLYVENVVIKTLASTFVEEMFENTTRKYLGRNEQVLAFLSASWSIVNIVEKSQSYFKVCRWHRYDHTTVLEELIHDHSDVPELNN